MKKDNLDEVITRMNKHCPEYTLIANTLDMVGKYQYNGQPIVNPITCKINGKRCLIARADKILSVIRETKIITGKNFSRTIEDIFDKTLTMVITKKLQEMGLIEKQNEQTNPEIKVANYDQDFAMMQQMFNATNKSLVKYKTLHKSAVRECLALTYEKIELLEAIIEKEEIIEEKTQEINHINFVTDVNMIVGKDPEKEILSRHGAVVISTKINPSDGSRIYKLNYSEPGACKDWVNVLQSWKDAKKRSTKGVENKWKPCGHFLGGSTSNRQRAVAFKIMDSVDSRFKIYSVKKEFSHLTHDEFLLALGDENGYVWILNGAGHILSENKGYWDDLTTEEKDRYYFIQRRISKWTSDKAYNG